ncbi:MAG TPA: chitinase [Polyangiaceae bacterium]|nr:chitinase [Polyangiaceae bacterium]
MQGSLPLRSIIATMLVALGCASRSDGNPGQGAGGSSNVGSSGGSTSAAGTTSSGGGTTSSGGSVSNSNCPAPGTFLVDNLENQTLWANWFTTNDATAGGTQTPTGAFKAELDPLLGYAAHTTGTGYTNWGAGLGINLKGVQGCFDPAQTDGLKFKAKGTGDLIIAAVIAGTVPPENGGTCMSGDLCFDTHKVGVALQPEWLQYEINWADLRQAGWGESAAFAPGELLTIQFVVPPHQMPFDFWMDDIELRQGTYVPPDPSSGGSGGSGPIVPMETITGVLADVLSSEQFNGMFPDRNGFYSYEGLLEAATKFPAFGCVGDITTRSREVAAFLGNVALETGDLVHIEELSPISDYCEPSNTQYPCAPGKSYKGRGPIQLSWNYNYGAAGTAIGRPLLENPELVATDAAVSWETALWFWMTSAPQGKTPHKIMVDGDGFGGTIRVINGGLECDGKDPGTVQDRVNHYTNFCSWLGVDGGGNLTC